MDLNYFDMVLLVILVLFLLRGVMNGVLAEFSGLLGILGGLWYASYAYNDITPYLSAIKPAIWRDFAAYGLVFVSVLLAASLLVHFISRALSISVIPAVDKSFGALLGFVRGMVICSISLILLRHFMPDLNFFKESLVMPWLQPFLNFAKIYLPASLV